MSSSRREGLLLGALLLSLLGLSATPALAGFTVNVEYRDPNGASASVVGTEAVFTFYRRTLYRKPEGPDAKKFRDDQVDLDAFSFRGSRVPFQRIREVRFEWRQESGREVLFLEFEMVGGERFERKGIDLEGAEHPISPAIRFKTPQGPMSVPLDPLISAAARAGHIAMIRMEFPGNAESRPRRPR